MPRLKVISITKLTTSLLLPFIAGAIGSLATFANIPTWYTTLAKPVFSPPNWVFGPVWTLLYILIGISLYLVWIAKGKHSKRLAFIFFGAQLVLNALWSLVFFGGHWLWGGVLVIILLLIAIGVTIRLFCSVSKPAGYLLVPYIAWVCFAMVLNIALAWLN